MGEDEIRVYFKDHSTKAALRTNRSSAEYFVELGWGHFNAKRTQLRLHCTREEASQYIKLADGRPYVVRPPLAESLRMGVHTIHKAAVNDSSYHQMLAEAYRCSPDKTRAGGCSA